MPRVAPRAERHATLPPVDPQRFTPTRERPVLANARHLDPGT